MKRLRIITGSILGLLFIVVSVNITAKVGSIRDLKKFDDETSANNTLSVIFAYTQVKGMNSSERKTIREAQRGFRDASNIKIHKKIKINFSQVNLDKVDTLASEYKLSKNPERASILLFKRGRHVETISMALTPENAQSRVYRVTKDAIDDNFGAYIDKILEEIEELEADIAIARASAPRYEYNPLYNPWWDYHYHGYYYPYYRRYQPGFGFYIGLD